MADILNEHGRLRSSIEVSAKQVLERPELLALIPPGTRTYLVDIGIAPEDMLVQAARQIGDQGLVAVTHMPARRFENVEAFERRVARMSGEAGVENVLAIAGEADVSGPLDSSLTMIRTGVFERHGIKTIAVAGHPDGAPDIAPEVILAYLRDKIAYAKDSDAQFIITTQFSFGAERILGWLDELVELGNPFPVHLGVAGPAKVTTLVRYAAMVGLEKSAAFMSKRGGSMLRLLMGYTPEILAAPLEQAIAAGQAPGLAQLHMYPFGGIGKVSEWLYARDSWERQSGD